MSTIQPSLPSFLSLTPALDANGALEAVDGETPAARFSSLFSLMSLDADAVEMPLTDGVLGKKLPLAELVEADAKDQAVDLSIMMAQLGYVVGPIQENIQGSGLPKGTELVTDEELDPELELSTVGAVVAVESVEGELEAGTQNPEVDEPEERTTAVALPLMAAEATNVTQTTPQQAAANLTNSDAVKPQQQNTVTMQAVAPSAGTETAEDSEFNALLTSDNSEQKAKPSVGLTLETEVKPMPVTQTLAQVVAAAAGQQQADGGAKALSNQNGIAATTEMTDATTQAAADLELELDDTQQRINGGLSQRIITMIKDNVQEARIHLDPPELGSLQIKLHIQHDQASIQIHAQNSHVRDMLELNAFRLRDALADEGLELSEFDVSSQSEQQTSEQERQFEMANSAAGEETAGVETTDNWQNEEGNALQSNQYTNSGASLLDTFA